MSAMTGLDVTIITGLSGAGRSSAANVFEDLGFFVIDNLPPALIPKMIELARGREEPTGTGKCCRNRRPRSTPPRAGVESWGGTIRNPGRIVWD